MIVNSIDGNEKTDGSLSDDALHDGRGADVDDSRYEVPETRYSERFVEFAD
jgi:hypothetical protein